MNILLLLVPISVVLLGVAIWAFAWAVRGGQFDDLDTPPLDILADDESRLPAEARARQGEGEREREGKDEGARGHEGAGAGVGKDRAADATPRELS